MQPQEYICYHGRILQLTSNKRVWPNVAVFIDISKNGRKVININFLFKLGYNDDGYYEFTSITNRKCRNWSIETIYYIKYQCYSTVITNIFCRFQLCWVVSIKTHFCWSVLNWKELSNFSRSHPKYRWSIAWRALWWPQTSSQCECSQTC